MPKRVAGIVVVVVGGKEIPVGMGGSEEGTKVSWNASDASQGGGTDESNVTSRSSACVVPALVCCASAQRGAQRGRSRVVLVKRLVKWTVGTTTSVMTML